MKRKIYAAAGAACLMLLAGCGGSVSYTDGTYEARSAEYINEDESSTEGNGYGIASVTISGGAITACTFTTYELDGSVKGEDYGKESGAIKNKDFYNKAQKAVAACEKYAEQLVETGDVNKVDAISGATINYGQFKEAVSDALKQAQSGS